MFLYVANNHKEIIPIWLSKDKDIIKKLRDYKYNAYYMYGFKGMYYNLRAKYLFSDSYFDSVNFWCCGGATKIQLWHGTPIKKIEHDAKNLIWYKPINRLIYLYFAPWTSIKYDYIISAADFFIDNIISAFHIKKENILVTGYPRNDVIFNHLNGENLTDIDTYDKLTNLKSNSNSKLILYMPTFRDNEYLSNRYNLNIIDFEELNNFLNKTNSYFIFKLHPIIKINLKDNYDRIIISPSGFDIYPILSHIDILITDYSSVYFDFLLVNKPIIFFPYDLEKYQKDDRELYFNYDEFTPGPKVFTFKELLNWIDYFIKGNDKFVPLRKKIMNLSFKYLDGGASEKIYDFVCSLN